ncbi:hypothetical protein [Hymenobacter seoulensis]
MTKKALLVAYLLGVMYLASGCGFNDPLESRFACSSIQQEFGEYNLEMEHFKLRERTNVEFALKLDDGIMKIYNVKLDKMWMEDSVTFHHEKDGLYYFQSTTPEHVNILGVTELPTKYVLNKKENVVWYMGMNRNDEDGGRVHCSTAIFHLNCQL